MTVELADSIWRQLNLQIVFGDICLQHAQINLELLNILYVPTYWHLEESANRPDVHESVWQEEHARPIDLRRRCAIVFVSRLTQVDLYVLHRVSQ